LGSTVSKRVETIAQVIEDVGNDLAHQLPHRRKSSGGYRPPCQVWGAAHIARIGPAVALPQAAL
jgi:hypothetical protein